MDQIGDALAIVKDKIWGWIDQFFAMLPNFVVAILIIVLFYFLAQLIGRLLSKTLNRITHNRGAVKLISSLTRISIIIAALFIALGILELNKTVTSLLAGVGIAGLAIGFAFKDAIANFLAGIYITFKSTVNYGDIMKFGDYMGTVKPIGLRALKLDTFQGQEVVIPNRLIFEDIYTHYTVNKVRRIDLNVGISYGDDLEKVEEITLEAINRINYLDKSKAVDLYFLEFGNSSINFVVRYWVNYNKQTDYLKALSDGIKNIKKSYDNNNITIPFPIRTLDFGIKGGEKLSEMMTLESDLHTQNKNEQQQ